MEEFNTFEEKVKHVAKKLEDMYPITYVYSNWAVVNYKLKKMPLPVLINLLPAAGSISIDISSFKDAPECEFAFLDKAEFDFEANENEVTVERCKGYAKLFVALLNESGLFEWVDEFTYQVVYDKLDVNMTGIVARFVLKEKEGSIICP
nr:MAG TPA: hypothetical protein [Caudoviricetes sp.]